MYRHISIKIYVCIYVFVVKGQPGERGAGGLSFRFRSTTVDLLQLSSLCRSFSSGGDTVQAVKKAIRSV